MNEKLQNDLVKAYPKIFKNVGFGIESHDGWYDLLDTLCYTMQQHCDVANTRYIIETDKYQFVVEGDPEYVQVVAAQVKEKLGTLRFYVDGGDATTEGMIQMAESMSSRLCELCGSPATTNRKSGWLHTTCTACDLKRQSNTLSQEVSQDVSQEMSQEEMWDSLNEELWDRRTKMTEMKIVIAQLRKGIEEAKQGKFSKNPPKIKPKKKKK